MQEVPLAFETDRIAVGSMKSPKAMPIRRSVTSSRILEIYLLHVLRSAL